MSASVREMVSDEQILATFGVMRQLRSHLIEGEYLERVERMRDAGYRLAAVVDDDRVRCVAGFRIQEFLYCGRHMYVDDLVTDEDSRSEGHGKKMFEWLFEEARKSGCEHFHLDSGVQRAGAHRFYFREGLGISSFHFIKEL